MKKFFALFLAATVGLTTSGCTSALMNKDRYAIDSAEYKQDTIEVIFVDYQDKKSFEESFAKNAVNRKDGYDVMAYSFIFKDSNKCVVHILNPQINYKPEWLGHEIAHCRYGRFHKH